MTCLLNRHHKILWMGILKPPLIGQRCHAKLFMEYSKSETEQEAQLLLRDSRSYLQTEVCFWCHYYFYAWLPYGWTSNDDRGVYPQQPSRHLFTSPSISFPSILLSRLPSPHIVYYVRDKRTLGRGGQIKKLMRPAAYWLAPQAYRKMIATKMVLVSLSVLMGRQKHFWGSGGSCPTSSG